MIKRILTTIMVVMTLGFGAAACGTYSDQPDEIGLYYNMGSIDGNVFGECIEPGAVGDSEWNNAIYWLPTNLRTWNITPQGGDSDKPTVISSAPEEGQPSGVQVKVWSTTNFYLNTFCDKDGGVIRQWWEKIGRKYGANTPDGWHAMLEAVVAPTLNIAIRDVIRTYRADELVGNINGIQAEAQKKISAQFATELRRVTGGDFFCGPAFNRDSKDCPPLETLIVDVDYDDPGIQEARNNKQKAKENAAATVAEAQGKVDAAAKLKELYDNPSWVALQLEQLRLEQVKACASNPNCTLTVVNGGNPSLLVNAHK